MVTQITLGNFTTQNGKNVLTGGASKLDTTALVNALADARRAPAIRLETLNKTIDSQTKAITDLRTIFAKLLTAADSLRNPPGVAVDSRNIFQYRQASLSSTTGAIASNFVDVSVQPGAVAQGYTIDSITQLAFQTKQQSGNITAANTTTASVVTASGAPTAGLFSAGTINLRAVDGTVGGVPLTLNAGDSLDVVASKFNELSSRTGIQASVLTVATGTYRLIFTATKSGETFGFDLGATSPAAGAGVISDAAGVFSQVAFNTTQPAQNAIFSIDGVPLERESNAVADVLSGVTLTLKQDTIPGAVLLNIVPDRTLVSNAITQFVDAYNEFRIFASRQSQVDENSRPTDEAVLYNNTAFRDLIERVNGEVSRIVAGITSPSPSQLRDVGVAIDNFAGDDENPATRNILVIDTDKLNASLLADFNGVRKLFEFQQTSDDSRFVNFSRSNNLSITSFSVAIDTVANTYQATYTDPVTNVVTNVDFDFTPITGGGVSLKGKAGTVFEGSQYVFSGTGTATVNVSLTQGFGDRFYNLANGVNDAINGTLANELTTLADNKERNTEEITSIDSLIVRYREQLVQQYAALESALSRANSILQLLDAQANARNNS